jgi:hypothetical protein
MAERLLRRFEKRRALLVVALGFALLDLRSAPEPPALRALRTWLGSWRGVGLITEAMWRQGYEIALTSDEHGWRATFIHRDHLVQPWIGQVLSWWSTPWRAVQEAAWKALYTPPPHDLSLIEESPQ